MQNSREIQGHLFITSHQQFSFEGQGRGTPSFPFTIAFLMGWFCTCTIPTQSAQLLRIQLPLSSIIIREINYLQTYFSIWKWLWACPTVGRLSWVCQQHRKSLPGFQVLHLHSNIVTSFLRLRETWLCHSINVQRFSDNFLLLCVVGNFCFFLRKDKRN